METSGFVCYNCPTICWFIYIDLLSLFWVNPIVIPGMKSMIHFIYISGYQLHREKRETGKRTQKNPCQGKHREIGNIAKTQGKHREFGFPTL